MYEKSIFLFHRDLRLEDNIGLIESLQKSKQVIPCFIYDCNLIRKLKDAKFRWRFLDESLLDLDKNLKKKGSSLQILEGIPEKILEKIIKKHKIEAVFSNADFSKYSQKRDKKIFQICKNSKTPFHITLDFLLHNPNDIKTNDDTPYTIYSFFYKKAKLFPIRKTTKNLMKNYSKENISNSLIAESETMDSEIKGGRKEGLKILKKLGKFENYEKVRNFPRSEERRVGKECRSRWSPYH